MDEPDAERGGGLFSGRVVFVEVIAGVGLVAEHEAVDAVGFHSQGGADRCVKSRAAAQIDDGLAAGSDPTDFFADAGEEGRSEPAPEFREF